MNIFRKTNPVPGSDNLLCEADGLARLEQALDAAGIGALKVPARLQVTAECLTLNRIDNRTPEPAQLQLLGQSLAQLHLTSAQALAEPRWGLERDNWIGRSPQRNGWAEDWGQFFVERRLQYQIDRIADAALRRRFSARLAAAHNGLVAFLNAGAPTPALVHGDLWNGNVLFERDRVWLIDPAIYFGDPEVDLAMTEMFGGFGSAFRAAYTRERPLSPDYPLKRSIYNLYHYLNHLNLFGSAYLPGCEAGFAAIDEAVHR
jgi:fructosamine-3-kinase